MYPRMAINKYVDRKIGVGRSRGRAQHTGHIPVGVSDSRDYVGTLDNSPSV